MPASEASDEFPGDVRPYFFHSLTLWALLLLMLLLDSLLTIPSLFPWQDFIVDIDCIQAHGTHSSSFASFYIQKLTIKGIGAADITKLKANGYFTIAVRSLTTSIPFLESSWDLLLCYLVNPRRDEENFAEDQRFQRDQGREGQGGHQ